MRKGFGVVLAVMLVADAGGQTLARKNWAGSGMSVQGWWSRAMFCRMPAGTLQEAGPTLDRAAAMGCDAVVIGPVAVGDQAGGAGDALMEGVVHRRMRLVMEMPVSAASEAEVTGRMRFWLARGVAGFVLQGSADAGMVHRLRGVAAGVVGTRVLIGDGIGGSPDLQLVVRHVGGGLAELRAALAAGGGSMLLAGGAGAGRVRAAILLGNGAAAEVPVEGVPEVAKASREFSADELMLWVPKGDPSLRQAEDARGAELTAWYGAVAELHHGNVALTTGQATYLNRDGQGVLAWVVRGKVGVAPVLVVVNLSGREVKVAVGAEVKGLGVRGGYLRTLLKAGVVGRGVATLEDIELGVDGVLVGEIH